MSLPLPLTLFFIFSIFQTVFSENCSEALLENFRKTFNLSDKCGNCTILKPESYFDNGNWSGICSRNRYLMFPEWKCGNSSVTLVLVSPNMCEILDENNFYIDDDCFAKVIDEKYVNMTPWRSANCRKLYKRSFTLGDSGNSQDKRRDSECVTNTLPGINSSLLISEEPDATEFKQRTSTTESTTIVSKSENPVRTKRTSTESTSTKGTETTGSTHREETEDTEPTTTEGTDDTESTMPEGTELTAIEETESMSTERTEQSSARETETFETSTQTSYSSTSHPITKTSKIFNSTNAPPSTVPSLKEICESNEYFFDNHCYFLKTYDTLKEPANGLPEESDLDKPINSTLICSTQHPAALGVAVETKKENEFILQILKRIYFLNQTKVLTSGIKTDNFGCVWLGWNEKINHTVLNFATIHSNYKHYVINPCKGYWELWDGNNASEKLFTMCERPYNPKKVLEELYKQCLELYRNSPCYNKDKHAKYCCARDENGEIWFACPDEITEKSYQGNVSCLWECRSDGHFSPFRPVCKGNISCYAKHNSITYIAPITTYAISGCPENFIGNSTWYCGYNKTFIGLPDYSLCCENAAICKDTDIFLNTWTGCPSKKIVKKTLCPPESYLSEAYVEWYCHSNGSFNGTIPDYSNCNGSDRRICSKKDRYGVQWTADLGTTTYKDCPPSFDGQCWWKCKESGEFDGSEPDCTWCRAKWMDNIAEKIKSDSRHEEVIAMLAEHTEKEDLRIGYGFVLHLTSECVRLYKKQNIDGLETCLQKFLKGYSKIFKSLVGSPPLWSSFSVSSRRMYAKNIIEITQNATFANLETGNVLSESYNATFADLKNDGFDFFVAYNPSIKGSTFPLKNPLESDWHLEVKEVNESNSNFAAMGLVMNYSLSSLMFPQGEETGDKEMNAPALTFAVAFSRGGKAIVDHNVSVSVSFKHINKTRFPETVEINRRLHKGEIPSGVFNSTICYYYSDSGWTSNGCSVTRTSKERTDCTCTHLSTIGLLMTIHKYVPDKTLEIMSMASSGITILSLILALLVFYFFDTVKNDRVLIGKNLCFCLLVGHVMLITVLDKRFFYIPDEFCKIYAVILHYTFMAAFAWMFVEGCHLYRMLVLVFDSDIEYRYVYLLTGYGVPLVVVGVTYLIGFAFQEQPYGQDELCWLKYPNYVWAFIGPVIVITLINFYILIIAMKLAISSRMRTESSNLSSFKLWLKGWFTLSSLLGITWLFGLALISYNKIVLYVFVIFNGLQGFFIFLFRCLLNEQYNDVILKRIKSLSSTFNSKYKKEDFVKSDTKVITISTSKSLSSSEMRTKEDVCDSEVLGGILEGKKKSKADIENQELDVTLKPPVSEAYLRNLMIAQNFAVRRSKATWINESDKSRYKF